MSDKPKHKNAPKRTPAQIKLDRVRITELHLVEKTQCQIAQIVGISRDMVAYDIAAIEEEWLQLAVKNVAKSKARSLARLQKMSDELWQAWERSKADAKRTMTESVADGDKNKPTRAKATVTKETRDGDAHFIDSLLKIEERKARILGLDAPTRLTTPDGGTIPIPTTQIVRLVLPSNGREAKK